MAELTPRAREAVERACREHARQRGFQEEATEKGVAFVRKGLARNGFFSVSVLKDMTLEQWTPIYKIPKGSEELLDRIKSLASDKLEAAATATVTSAAKSMGASSSAVGLTADTRGVASSVELECRDLRTPPATFGTKGERLQLVANHFLLQVTGEDLAWVAWQVDFPEAPSAQGRGSAARGPGREVRKAAVRELLKQLDPGAWLYDGYHRLYTKKGGEKPSTGDHMVKADRMRSPLMIQVSIATAEKTSTVEEPQQQELNLGKLGRLSPPGNMADDVSEERRFLQVAMRSYATGELELPARGRRVFCPGMQLAPQGESSDLALRHGRELWMGYLAQLEIIHGENGPRCTLNLNLVATVGLSEMSVIRLVAKMLAESYRKHARAGNAESDAQWFEDQMLAQHRWPRELDEAMLRTLDSETGLKKLRVCTSHLGYRRVQTVVGVTRESARQRKFFLHEENREITVEEYFKKKHGVTLQCPELPCLSLNKREDYTPIELVTVLGGEHNILVGKLRPDYQDDVVRRTAMPPERRRDAIRNLLGDRTKGPRNGLKEKGIDVDAKMLSLTGRVLCPPAICCKKVPISPNGYASRVVALAPPKDPVMWGLWSYTQDQQWELDGFAKEVESVAWSRGLHFNPALFKTWPEKSWEAYFSRGASEQQIQQALREDLQKLNESHFNRAEPQKKLRILFVLLPSLPATKDRTDWLYSAMKMIVETEICNFTTQCIKCSPKGPIKSGIEAAKQKLNMLMVKVASKLPQRVDAQGESHGTAHHVQLQNPHPLLQASSRTMVLGADVTHNVAGVSVAGVVASRDAHFVGYFSELRGQTPFARGLEGQKTRTRKSEERILELKDMTVALLRRWEQANNGLPDVVLYYRDGVSDGQFAPVLKRERNHLAEAFEEVGGRTYDPKLVVIVGQKRHQTRLFLPGDAGAGASSGSSSAGKGGWGQTGGQKGHKGDVKGEKGKGKGGGQKQPGQVPPGTVADKGLAQTDHLNFFLVAHEGIQGTSVPCHYHVLHFDPRLSRPESNAADDLQEVTYQLCHLYPRADKTVSYASPAYLADHLCERGKRYLESVYGEMSFDDSASSRGGSTGGASEENETKLRSAIEERVTWLNKKTLGAAEIGESLQGLNFFC